jgi:hypothetical protein
MNQSRGILLATVLCLTPLAGCSGDDSSATTPAGRTSGTELTATATSGTATALSTVGTELVPGFPSDVVPVPPSTTVTSSAIEPTDSLVQLSLSGDTSLSAAEILKFYRTALTAQKFTVVEGEILPDSVPGLAFSRNDEKELLTLTVTDNKDHRSFSIGGNILS